jgi:hypothetical protein
VRRRIVDVAVADRFSSAAALTLTLTEPVAVARRKLADGEPAERAGTGTAAGDRHPRERGAGRRRAGDADERQPHRREGAGERGRRRRVAQRRFHGRHGHGGGGDNGEDHCDLQRNGDVRHADRDATGAGRFLRRPFTQQGRRPCVADENSQLLDCVFDGSASQGFIGTYLWTYTMGARTQQQTSSPPNAAVSPQGTGCDLYQQGTGGDGPNGERYLRMEATLQVRDAAGVVSDVVRQQVKVYPNHQCGFSY